MQDSKERIQNIGCINCEFAIGHGTRRRQTGNKTKRPNAVEVLLKSIMVFIPNPLVVPVVRIQRSSSVELWRGDLSNSSPPPNVGGKVTQMAETKEVLETFISNFKGVIPSGWSLEDGAYVGNGKP
ncbi:hypothetical protein LOTGIDRAFT_166449 [Lottia gigantea]|uniref:Uncharacterized protein n=1 Tax=Lottia gigantea TaxID=225164 RepID=V4BF96_LOTGI|nr:hypothetical protein LOTGIDRAFT_166449 [Lottia gigantea]ESO87569.1 hypothetical protein LOTGIDRAFT_166449 [Lottia gigantea]